MKSLINCVLLVWMVGASSYALAQQDTTLKRNIASLEKYAVDHPAEKVHLHIDRQLYFPGDTIWFKAYVVIGAAHQLSALSNILYAELIGPKDTILKRLTLGLNAGTAPGDFELPYNAAPGNYHIRAYTNWMLNFGTEYLFDQQITVSGFNTLPAASTARATADKIDLQFFPEGGDLINGLRSKVAFKAVNQDGMAEEVQGSIRDNAGNEVATFNSQHLGMGVFPLYPEQGKRYTARVTAADGSSFTLPLPQARDNGYALTINNSPGDSVYIKVAARNVSDTAFYLLAQSGGKEYYAASGKVAGKPFAAAVPKNRFPTGVVQFTLFSQKDEPVCERIVFIQINDQLKLAINTDKQSYAPGGEVKVNIKITGDNEQPVIGAFSVAVLDESKTPLNEETENTMFTDLLLRSEIAGYIQDPNYYFINPDDKTKADLDLLMLTQGYRKFEWKEILKNNAPGFARQPEKGFTVSGVVTTPAGKPVVNGPVFLTSTKHMLVMDTVTDKEGRFVFANIMIQDTAKLVVNAKKPNGGENVVLKVDKQVYPAITTSGKQGYIQNHFTVSTAQLQQAYRQWKQDSTGHAIQLKEVKITDKKKNPFHPDYTVLLKHSPNLNGPGQADQVIMGDDLVPSTNLSASLAIALRGGVRLVYTPSGDVVIFSTHTPIALTGSTKPMAVLVDGVIQGQGVLKDLNVGDIQGIEMLESHAYSAIYGSEAYGGLIVITTKYGDEPNAYITRLKTDLTIFDFRGFYKARQFYSPKYSANRSVTLADNRHTVYWQPDIITNEKGEASFSYFSTGDNANCRIMLQGITTDGRLGTQTLNYKVELNN